METDDAIRNDIAIEAMVCKNLALLASESGITTLATFDIDEIVAGRFDTDLRDILKRLKQAHRIIHEALYAPPRK